MSTTNKAPIRLPPKRKADDAGLTNPSPKHAREEEPPQPTELAVAAPATTGGKVSHHLGFLFSVVLEASSKIGQKSKTSQKTFNSMNVYVAAVDVLDTVKYMIKNKAWECIRVKEGETVEKGKELENLNKYELVVPYNDKGRKFIGMDDSDKAVEGDVVNESSLIRMSTFKVEGPYKQIQPLETCSFNNIALGSDGNKISMTFDGFDMEEAERRAEENRTVLEKIIDTGSLRFADDYLPAPETTGWINQVFPPGMEGTYAIVRPEMFSGDQYDEELSTLQENRLIARPDFSYDDKEKTPKQAQPEADDKKKVTIVSFRMEINQRSLSNQKRLVKKGVSARVVMEDVEVPFASRESLKAFLTEPTKSVPTGIFCLKYNHKSSAVARSSVQFKGPARRKMDEEEELDPDSEHTAIVELIYYATGVKWDTLPYLKKEGVEVDVKVCEIYFAAHSPDAESDDMAIALQEVMPKRIIQPKKQEYESYLKVPERVVNLHLVDDNLRKFLLKKCREDKDTREWDLHMICSKYSRDELVEFGDKLPDLVTQFVAFKRNSKAKPHNKFLSITADDTYFEFFAVKRTKPREEKKKPVAKAVVAPVTEVQAPTPEPAPVVEASKGEDEMQDTESDLSSKVSDTVDEDEENSESEDE